MMSDADLPITRETFESLCAWVGDREADPKGGIFGPESISWKVNREAALFLGAGRAALLQLAHPWVAAALDQHSNLRNDPLERFHNTFRVIFTMVFGTRAQALAASRHLYQLHSHIEGELPESAAAYSRGSRYQANEANALCWVYSTLVESALIAYESVLPALPPNERESYYTESKTMAALFGIPGELLPRDWEAFERYNLAMLASGKLGVNTLSRELSQRILHGRGSWIPIPGWYCALTAAWMPAPLRDAFELDFGPNEQAAARRAFARLPQIYPRLPRFLRFVGPYREAIRRLQGRKPGLLVQVSNRFWMGQRHTMFRGEM
ncbi:hypothetical protein ACPOL_5507 [Acidisarcina polymorpha]|uniref:ER-bound oxygenase mpaB/mpaB'/Rubber oxygenase catalytic domain-containing protein n=1 Tax=Acidisarcina polymorpha TaxID=2211140 RepID=A0A2Z5G7W8_9BACT|nr:oxygenase MpaB family protein [Acidisarcina polymorpha]AXC14755.1 hypothetical protein ACPOL_5507 [Acidisarcina polymorpha]